MATKKELILKRLLAGEANYHDRIFFVEKALVDVKNKCHRIGVMANKLKREMNS